MEVSPSLLQEKSPIQVSRVRAGSGSSKGGMTKTNTSTPPRGSPQKPRTIPPPNSSIVLATEAAPLRRIGDQARRAGDAKTDPSVSRLSSSGSGECTAGGDSDRQQQVQQSLSCSQAKGAVTGSVESSPQDDASTHREEGEEEGEDTPQTYGQSSFAGDKESLMDLLDEVYSDTASMSGYSAYSARRDDTEPINYYIRLVKFYQRYNPEKLGRVEEFLGAYKGEEEQLFTILSDKYGPEPNPPSQAERDEIASDFGGGHDLSSNLSIGSRTLVPKVVSPADGYTDCPTPYWPGTKAVRDTDLLELLLTGDTKNKHLSSCFLGMVKAHPKKLWNGLTYITRDVVKEAKFLGHQWSGSLANNKKLVYSATTFDRCVLHCSDDCVKEQTQTAKHERWRLTMYQLQTDASGSPIANPPVLYRTVWDPLLHGGTPRRLGGATAAGPGAYDLDLGPGPGPVMDTPRPMGGDKEGKQVFAVPTSKHGRRPPPPPQPKQPEQAKEAKEQARVRMNLMESGSLQPPTSNTSTPPAQQSSTQLETFISHIQTLEARCMGQIEMHSEKVASLETSLDAVKRENAANKARMDRQDKKIAEQASLIEELRKMLSNISSSKKSKTVVHVDANSI